MSDRRLFVVLILVFLAGLFIGHWAATGGIEAVDAHLAALAPWFLAGRLSIVAWVVGGWGWITARAARRGHWPPERAAAVTAWRWRVLGWFAVFEIVFVQDGYGRLVRWLAG
jgi:hypothetical protein